MFVLFLIKDTKIFFPNYEEIMRHKKLYNSENLKAKLLRLKITSIYIRSVLILRLINIIMLCRQHGYPWPSFATSPDHSSPPAGLLDYIPYPHIVAVCKFELVVQLLHGHMWGSIGVHQLWARPCFSSSVPRVWFV